MLEKINESIKKAIHHLDVEFSKLQVWRANPALVEDIMVEQYWMLNPLKNIATVWVLDAQTLTIKPYDKSSLGLIAKSITEAGLGLNPQTMADSVLIKMPTLTEERRKELVKIAKKIAEEAKIWIRNARQEVLKNIKKAEDDKEISEDEAKKLEKDLQKIIDDANKEVDERLKKKTDDIMTI